MSSRNEHVKYAVTIDRPRMEVYEFWRNWSNLPRFSPHLVSVRPVGENITEWTASAPRGTVTWRAETVEDTPGEQIGWRSIEGSEIENHGVVQFLDAPDNRGTEVRLYLSYEPKGGVLGKLVAKSTGNEPEQEVGEMMRRFKCLLECGELPVVEGQPSNLMRGENQPGEAAAKVGLR